MIISIQQPEYFPWLGFFDKLLQVDKVVFLDNVQFKKRYFENRNRIRVKNGACWIRTPVVSKGRFRQLIMNVEIDNTQAWQRKLTETIRHSYSKTKYWKAGGEDLCQLIESKPYTHLVDFNFAVIFFIMKKLGIGCDYLLASSIGTTSSGSDLILEICKKIKARVYLSGRDGRKYLHEGPFKKAGIEIIYHDFVHPVYHQHHAGAFMPAMSVIDLFFNHGQKSVEIFRGC